MVIEHKDKLLEQGRLGIERLQNTFPGSTTWNYAKYNLFNLTAGYPVYYKLFQELKQVIHYGCNVGLIITWQMKY